MLFVSKNVIDLQNEPMEKSEVIDQTLYGTQVQLLMKNGEWAQIQLPNGDSGWTKWTHLLERNQPYPHQAKVDILWTYIYHTADTSPYPPVISLSYHTKVEVISSSQQRWMQIRLLDGNTYFAQKADFTFNLSPLSKEQLIYESKKFLGLPYRWGGNSGFGFDCSGLVQTLFYQAGILLPRNSKDQAKEGKPVEKEALMAADLIFFGKDVVNHVGLYIGNQQFIHAVTTNEIGPHVVQISSLGHEEWSRKYLCGRRFF